MYNDPRVVYPLVKSIAEDLGIEYLVKWMDGRINKLDAQQAWSDGLITYITCRLRFSDNYDPS